MWRTNLVVFSRCYVDHCAVEAVGNNVWFSSHDSETEDGLNGEICLGEKE